LSGAFSQSLSAGHGHYDQDALALLDGERHQLGRFNADR
jgi:hypothetical protein